MYIRNLHGQLGTCILAGHSLMLVRYTYYRVQMLRTFHTCGRPCHSTLPSCHQFFLPYYLPRRKRSHCSWPGSRGSLQHVLFPLSDELSVLACLLFLLFPFLPSLICFGELYSNDSSCQQLSASSIRLITEPYNPCAAECREMHLPAAQSAPSAMHQPSDEKRPETQREAVRVSRSQAERLPTTQA